MALAALVVAQFVMLLVMTITPVHVRGHDHGLSGVGLVISLHVFGMFGLAPVASLTSGFLVAGVGYPFLSAFGAALAAVMAVIVAMEFRREAVRSRRLTPGGRPPPR